MVVRETSFRLHLCVSSVLTAAVWIIVATPAAAQDTTGVGAIARVVVSAGDPRSRIFAVPLTALADRRPVAVDPEYPDRQSGP